MASNSRTGSAAKKGTASKGAAPKKAATKQAPQKAASKSAAKKKPAEFREYSGKKGAPKNGTLVEFIDATPKRGIFVDGAVHINGIAHTSIHSLREVDMDSLDDVTKSQLQGNLEKAQAFQKLGVPPHRVGENLHEQNPDMAADVMRNNAANFQRNTATARAQANTNYGEQAEETIAEIEGHDGTGFQNNDEKVENEKD